jgi:hypothetical protein
MFFIGIEQNCYGNEAPKSDEPLKPKKPSEDPVDTHTGNLFFIEKDLLIQDSVNSLLFARRYI